MASSTKFPVTATGNGTINAALTAFTNASNVCADDAFNLATKSHNGLGSRSIKCTNFGFAIPTDATITGIAVIYEGYHSGYAAQSHTMGLKLVKGDVASGDIKYGVMWDTLNYWTYGGSSDLWGNTFTPADINGATFGVEVWNQTEWASGSITYIDYIKIIVYYSCSGSITITTTSLPSGEDGLAYSQTVVADQLCTFSVVSGALPTGLALTGATGVISGTPSAVGTFNFTVRATSTCDTSITDDQALTIIIYAYQAKTVSDLVASVTETISKITSSIPYVLANNNQCYVLNMKTGGWSFIDNWPFSNMIYSPKVRQIGGARRDLGNLSILQSGNTFDGTSISWYFQTGYYNFGELDEVKGMPSEAAEAIKRLRALFTEIKSAGNVTCTVYTENDSTGIAFTITPATADNIVYNMVRTALSRSIRGKYVSFKFSGTVDFWMGETGVKIKPREVK